MKAIACVGGVLALALSAGAAAQTSAPPPAAAAEPAWKVICPEATESTPAQPCSLMQNLVAGEQRQRLLTVILQRQAQGYGMTLALPHGVLFPAGVSLQIDDGAETPLAVQTSDQNGAYAGSQVDAAMMNALKTGTTLKVGFTAGNGQRIIVPVTLRDLTAGIADLDSRPMPPAAAPATS